MLSIAFNLPDGSIIHPPNVGAFGVPGLLVMGYTVRSDAPLKQVSATGFNEASSVYLGGNTGVASGSLYWYTPPYPAGDYTLTVKVIDEKGATIEKTATYHLAK